MLGQASNKGNNTIMFKDYDHTTYIIDNRFTTVEDFKAWLENHNIIIYYRLETSTTIEITDTTLLSQLEALANAKSYNGTTIIDVDTLNLKPYLSFDYYAKD